MDYHEETFETWNKVAGLYQEKFMDLSLYNDSYDYLCNSISKQKPTLLDIGCGPGNITKYLLSKRSDLDIFGIDIAPNMIELAKMNNPNAKFAVMDARQINNLNTGYDGIICGFCLPYLSSSESNQLISNSSHLLKENGLLYLSFVEGDPSESGFKTGSGGRVYFQFHNLRVIKAQLRHLKFVEIKTFKVKYRTSETGFDIHTIVIAKKKSGYNK